MNVSLKATEIRDTRTTTMPFHIPDGIRVVELDQGLRISHRLPTRHGYNTVHKVHLLSMGGSSARASLET